MRLIERLRDELDDLGTLLLDQACAGVLIMDDQARIVRVNAGLRDLLGPGAACGAGASALGLFVEDDRVLLWEQLGAHLQGRLPPSPLAARLIRTDGGSRDVELSPAAVWDGGDRASGLIVQVRDLTPRRRLEAELAHGQKLQAVGLLAAGIAHDFNNLLTAIIGAAEMIEQRDAPGIDSARDAAEIRGSAERGAALVRQLLAFGRQQALQPRVVHINEAVATVASLLGRLLGSTVALTLDLQSPGGFAIVDPTQLDQVLINLACNGRDAMPDGGALTLRSGHITFYRPLVRGPETIPPGRYIMIEVQDTGIGIDPEVLPRIFDPFFTTRRERGGTGLGLSTVHGIVRQSRGFLGVESEPGRGTSVRVYLPRCDPQPATVAGAAPPPPNRPPGGRLVLLVDDEEKVRRLAQRALDAAGWRVLAAESAEAALTMADDCATAPDLLVSDVVMPGIDGPTLARQLRRRWPLLPVLMTTGYAGDRLRDDLTGATEMLLKPYGLAELVRRAVELSSLTVGDPAESGIP